MTSGGSDLVTDFSGCVGKINDNRTGRERMDSMCPGFGLFVPWPLILSSVSTVLSVVKTWEHLNTDSTDDAKNSGNASDTDEEA